MTSLTTPQYPTNGPNAPVPWWADAVIYQIYPRSFGDSDGDGVGDLPGITARLPYLAELGVDAIWLSPFYVSPQVDAGYDVANYTDVDPLFGTLEDFDDLVAAASAARLKVIVDLVPNHSSDLHPWFVAALAAEPGSPERARYIFRDGTGPKGSEPPNNWGSVFGGSAWTRVLDYGEPGQWYLHLFDVRQPDFDWSNPEVADFFDGVLRFWLDRGVDGFRVDVAHGLTKADQLPNSTTNMRAFDGAGSSGPMWDQDSVHDIYRRWHRVLEEYPGDRMLVAEAWVAPLERLARYIRHDEMQQAFNFTFMKAGWDAARLRAAIVDSITANSSVDAITTWVLSNHDAVRHPSRFGLTDPTDWPNGISARDEQPNAAIGLARGRAASLLMLALPGSAYLYQGEELGLPEHTTLPAEFRQDPTFFRTNGEDAGRDGCRVPLPWIAGAPGYGFSPTGASWLPQPPAFRNLAADVQERSTTSTLALYRSAIALRAQYGLGRGELVWNTGEHDGGDHDGAERDGADAGAGTDAGTRLGATEVIDVTNGAVRVICNVGSTAVPVPAGTTVLIRSDPATVAPAVVAPNAAVWLVASA